MRAGVTVQASRGVNPPDRSVTELTPERAERGSELHERRREEVEVLLGGELEERLRRGPCESERLLGDDVFPVLEREARRVPRGLSGGVSTTTTSASESRTARASSTRRSPGRRVCRPPQVSRRRAQTSPSRACPRATSGSSTWR